MLQQYQIRPASSSDSAAIASFDKQFDSPAKGEEFYDRYCSGQDVPQGNASGHCHVAEAGDEVVGHIIYSRVLDEAEIINIIVAPALRGQGIGRALLRAALYALGPAGVSCCRLEVRESNAAAIGLYRAEGFCESGRREGYYPAEDGTREDALLMFKEL